MSKQSYLIDTNILIGLEDYRKVETVYASFSKLASKHKIDMFLHEATIKDIRQDQNLERREITLTKAQKYRTLKTQRGLTEAKLTEQFGHLKNPNDIVDATLLQAVESNAVDFLVTQDKGLHRRAERHSAELGRRVLFMGDATQHLIQTYEPKEVPIRHVADVMAHEIDRESNFFDSLREGYPDFDGWWLEKCVKQRRPCWVVYDNETLAGLIVRKDETGTDTDAITRAEKILKICTFKVSPEKRGVKLGELLLKQVLWYAQTNRYDLAYLTTYDDQVALMSLLEFYGFENAGKKQNGELIYERRFSQTELTPEAGSTAYDLARKNYPRFLFDEDTRGFGIPIKEGYHDILYPDLSKPRQPGLFGGIPNVDTLTRPGNTIRKVYLCRASSALGPPGSILFFYKGRSKEPPSQAMTALCILESVTLAKSTKELMRLTGGRSVYSEKDLEFWEASKERPVKVINYLLVSYIEPPIELEELRKIGVVKRHLPQSIYKLRDEFLTQLVARSTQGPNE